MIGRCLREHLTQPVLGAIRWFALAACLGGCAAPLSRGGNPGTATDGPANTAEISPAASVAASDHDHDHAPIQGEVAEAAAPPSSAVPAPVADPPASEPSLPVIELASIPETEAGPSLPVIELTALETEGESGSTSNTPVQPAGKGPEPAPIDEAAVPAACTSCGQYHVAGAGGAAGGSCGAGGCVPGQRRTCYHAEASTFVGRFATNLYHCLCCPDPCYEPVWVPAANAAFFTDPARPRTQKRLRWDHAYSFWFPDRSEYFWARSFHGPGPQPRTPVTKNGKPIYGERMLNYDQLYVYMEAALPRFSVFTEIPYRSTSPELTPHHAGFSDMNIGTKSLLLDCDLMQLALEFKTYLPIGNVAAGLGNGHVSLEPSLLMAVHLAPVTYLQGQIAEWVPIGGDPNYAGAILHYHLSMNHLICQVVPNVPLIATLEFNGWSFQDGAFTAPFLGPQNSSGDTYLSLGPGLRMSVCNYIDFGVGTAFALNTPNWGEPLIRSEMRIFY